MLLGLVWLMATFFGLASLGPFLAVRRFQGATTTPIVALTKGTEVNLRGVIAGVRRAPPYPRLTPGEVVMSELSVVERVGKQRNLAFEGRCSQIFALRDDAGQSIDADPRSAALLDAHPSKAPLKKTEPTFQGWMLRQGRWRWPNTPAICHELALKVGDKVMIHGQVILPLPAEMRDGDSELRVLVTRISLLVPPWESANGRVLEASLIGFAVSTVGIVAWVAWAAWL